MSATAYPDIKRRPKKYVPQFKGPIEGFVVNHMKLHYWRVARTVPREDLLQDAQEVFYRVKAAYPGVDNPRHFQSLFMRSWVNHFNDLSTKDTADRVNVPLPQYPDGESAYEAVGETDNAGYLRVMVKEAPAEVRMVLNLFLSAPQELLDLALKGWGRDSRSTDKVARKKICRMLGLPESIDPVQITVDYFNR